MFWDHHTDRTEAPSRRRRDEARRQGRVARSAPLSAALMIGGAAGVLVFTGRSLADSCARLISQSLSQTPVTTVDQLPSIGFATGNLADVLLTTLTMLGCLWILACGVNLLQIGPLLTADPLRPRLSRISPWGGVDRLLSSDTLVRGVLLVTQVIAVALLVCWTFRQRSEMLAELSSLPVTRSAAAIGGWLGVFGLQLSVLLMVIAAADYGWQRWRYELSLRMTRQEVRDEQRDAERQGGRSGRRSGRQQTSSHRAAVAGLPVLSNVEQI